MRKLKILTAVLIILCLAVSLCGCGGETEENDDRTIITIWSSSSHSKATYTKLAEEFNETTGKEKGIKVVYEVKEGDISQQIDLALASDQAPELFIAGNVAQLAEKGQLASLEDIGCDDLIETYKDALIRETHTYNGKTYCVPISATTRGLIYNKDMFKDAGLVDEKGEPTPPETWDEIREYAKKLTNAKEKNTV